MQDPQIRREPWNEEGTVRPARTPGVWFIDPPAVSWKAGAALALGVLSLATCGFSGALAVVCGAWALVEIGSSNGRRTGVALAIIGTVLGAITAPFSFLILLGMLVDNPKPEPQPFVGERPVVERPGFERRAPAEDDVARRLAQWRGERERIEATLAAFTAEREELKTRLREEGVTTSADLAGAPRARFIAEELVELEKQIRLAQRKQVEHNEAIARIESLTRRLERRRMLAESGVSEQELQELLQTSLELDGELKAEAGVGPAVDIEMEALLEEALKAPPPTGDPPAENSNSVNEPVLQK